MAYEQMERDELQWAGGEQDTLNIVTNVQAYVFFWTVCLPKTKCHVFFECGIALLGIACADATSAIQKAEGFVSGLYTGYSRCSRAQLIPGKAVQLASSVQLDGEYFCRGFFEQHAANFSQLPSGMLPTRPGAPNAFGRRRVAQVGRVEPNT